MLEHYLSIHRGGGKYICPDNSLFFPFFLFLIRGDEKNPQSVHTHT